MLGQRYVGMSWLSNLIIWVLRRACASSGAAAELVDGLLDQTVDDVVEIAVFVFNASSLA